MIETAAALRDIDRVCAVPGLSGIYVGPADLAISLGVEVAEATTHPVMREAMAVVRDAASTAGLIAGIHGGDGARGHDLAQLGYQMITLAAESQALRRGAVEHLNEARGLH